MSETELPLPVPPKDTAWLNDKTYNILKNVVQLGLPALATLYFTLAQVWGWANAEAVVASAAALATFLGVVLALSRKSYVNSEASYDGEVVITEDGGGRMFSLNLNLDTDELANKTQVWLKVPSAVKQDE